MGVARRNSGAPAHRKASNQFSTSGRGRIHGAECQAVSRRSVVAAPSSGRRAISPDQTREARQMRVRLS